MARTPITTAGKERGFLTWSLHYATLVSRIKLDNHNRLRNSRIPAGPEIINPHMPTHRTIDRYLVREIAHPLLGVCTALLVIFITYSLSRLLVDADAGLLQAYDVARLTALKALIALDVLLPLSMFIAIMVGLGRLYTDSEIHAMRAGGVSEAHLLRTLMRAAFVLAAVVALLSTGARPWAYAKSYAIRAEAEAAATMDNIRASRFYSFGDDERTVFIERIADNGRDLEGVFVRTQKGDDLQVITAAGGTFERLARPGLHRLDLDSARLFRQVSGGTDFSALFGAFTIWMAAERPVSAEYRVKAMPSGALRHSMDAVDTAEFQWRLSTPISTLLLTLAAIPLSRARPRQGRYAKMLLALAIYAVYFNLLDVARSWVEQGSIRSIWWVPCLLAVAVAGLYAPVVTQKWKDRRAQD
jgi:lipopolysaccharide export system permease protein